MHASDIRKRNTKRQHNVHRILIHKTNVRFEKKGNIYNSVIYELYTQTHISTFFSERFILYLCVLYI